VPSRCAPLEELCELSSVVGEFSGTSIEFVPGTGMTPTGRRFTDEQVEALVSMSVAAKRPVNWNLLVVTADTIEESRGLLAAGEVARSRGGKVVGLVMPEALPSRYNFRTGFILDLVPSIHDFFFLPVEERIAILNDPERRAEFRRAAEEPCNFSHLVDWKTRYITETFSSSTAKYARRLVGDIAAEEGKDPFDLVIEIVLADDLRTTFSSPPAASTASDWMARAEIFADRNAVVGGSDAGAHLDAFTQFAYPTRLLEHGVREHGVVSVEEAVRLLTSVPADLYGFHARGRLAPGFAADVVVLDLDAVGVGPITTKFDLPGDAGRLYAAAEGYDHVLVNGVEIATRGEFTGERPGRIMRRGLDTVTPALT
jgi:N-acyl-D-aspartate/D-glutamate deacylase